MKVLVTGGLGYIGSHTSVELLEEGHEVVVLDNLSNSKEEVKDKIKQITGKEVKFYLGDMINEELLDEIFTKEKIDAVIDFAAYKAVGESVKKLVFSSSATVYGNPEHVPIKETDKIGGTTNPYGTSKLFVEQILKDLYKSDNTWDIAILRYFNPIGAHKSGLIGEEPNGIPANLMPYIAKVANKELECLSVFGNDYKTKDGTGVRDYIHVVDLAKGHIKALEKLAKEQQGLYIYNLGTGTGYSVLDIINAFEKVNNIKVNYKITDRRPGDIAECYSDPSKAKEELGWEATLTIEDMCRDAYNFVKKESHE